MSSDFWDWFRENSEALKRIRSADSPEYAELQRRVAQLSPDIDAEIGGSPSSDDLELVFTAHGEQRCFPLIDQIVGDAPLLGGWRIRALKPPLLEDFSVRYGDQEITTREIWLQIESTRDAPLRLAVAIRRESDSDQDRNRESAALLVIESFLGERAYALQIAVDRFVDLPNDPSAEGFVSLRDVADRLRLSAIAVTL